MTGLSEGITHEDLEREDTFKIERFITHVQVESAIPRIVGTELRDMEEEARMMGVQHYKLESCHITHYCGITPAWRLRLVEVPE